MVAGGSLAFYEWVNDGFEVYVAAGDIKLTHLARDPRAAVMLAEDTPPYRGFQLDGEGRISSPPDAASSSM